MIFTVVVNIYIRNPNCSSAKISLLSIFLKAYKVISFGFFIREIGVTFTFFFVFCLVVVCWCKKKKFNLNGTLITTFLTLHQYKHTEVGSVNGTLGLKVRFLYTFRVHFYLDVSRCLGRRKLPLKTRVHR